MPRPGRFALAIALVFALCFLFIASLVVYTAAAHVVDPFAQLDWRFLIFIFGLTAAEYGLVLKLGIGRVGGLSLRGLGWRWNSASRDVSFGFLGGVAACLAIVALGVVAGEWSLDSFLQAQLSYAFEQRLLFLLIGMNAGFIEESVFRGFLQPLAIDRFDRWAGLVFTAAIFALYHLQFAPVAFAGKFVLGLIFGSLRGRDRSLARPAVAHALTWVIMGAS